MNLKIFAFTKRIFYSLYQLSSQDIEAKFYFIAQGNIKICLGLKLMELLLLQFLENWEYRYQLLCPVLSTP